MLQVYIRNCTQINATKVFIYLHVAAKTSVLQYVLYWPYALSIQVVCWKLFIPIPRKYCTFFLFGNSLQNTQNILISFPSSRSHLYLSFHASRYLRVFLVKAGVSDPLLISLLHDDCFPPKKEYNEPCTCFHFDILWLMFYFTKGKHIQTFETTVHFVSRRTQTFTPQENT